VKTAMSLDPRILLLGKQGVAAALPPTVYLLLLLLIGGTWAYLSSSSDRLGKPDSIPFLNLGKLCEQAAAQSTPAVAHVSSCAKNEQAAETQLIRNWKRYPALNRTACISELDDDAPSYIELLTCLDLKGSELAIGQ